MQLPFFFGTSDHSVAACFPNRSGGTKEQMLYVILNWAQRMITDTCAADIKLHAELWLQMEMANTTDLCSFGTNDVPPYALRSEAPSQLHLSGPTVFTEVSGQQRSVHSL